jgi:hypothetical protein
MKDLYLVTLSTVSLSRLDIPSNMIEIANGIYRSGALLLNAVIAISTPSALEPASPIKCVLGDALKYE